ncbi:GGDEF domain-containing protein [Mesorhizobium intechi]|uniref:GGDEF domain-containing protein n=1 Tax=Mesorhizobium intechi TaxID=537601 RepID=A0A8T9AU79_9HYPH|nr:GGDEF domain-containing protein [Mesorhizobium intechi]TSE11632.1 GGDEF domain-containing protein [Mesorhizobium intechi]
MPASRPRENFEVQPPSLAEVVVEMVDNLDAMVAYWDANQKCVFANAAYLDWFGCTGKDLIGTRLQDLLGPLYALNLPYIAAAYSGKKQVFERAIPTREGGVRHSLATYIPRFENGTVQGIFVHVADVGPLKKLEAELKGAKDKAEKLATHDHLTGLPNRVTLNARISAAISEAGARGGGFGVFWLDLDSFKSVNDTHGHLAGDFLLVQMAERIKGVTREHDSLLRIGGDEFVMIAGNVTSAVDAQNVADRVLAAVREPLRIGDVVISTTLSIGAAIYPLNGVAPTSLLHSSDRALYAAKNAGRDRVEIAA